MIVLLLKPKKNAHKSKGNLTTGIISQDSNNIYFYYTVDKSGKSEIIRLLSNDMGTFYISYSQIVKQPIEKEQQEKIIEFLKRVKIQSP